MGYFLLLYEVSYMKILWWILFWSGYYIKSVSPQLPIPCTGKCPIILIDICNDANIKENKIFEISKLLVHDVSKWFVLSAFGKKTRLLIKDTSNTPFSLNQNESHSNHNDYLCK